MFPFRCYNPDCSTNVAAGKNFDFWAVDPVCPKCGADKRKPEEAGIVSPLAVVHFEPPHPKFANMSRGAGYNACTKKIKGMRSGDPRAVNCPKCLETPEIKTAIEHWDCLAEMPPESAFEAFKRIAPIKAMEYEAAQAGGE